MTRTEIVNRLADVSAPYDQAMDAWDDACDAGEERPEPVRPAAINLFENLLRAFDRLETSRALAARCDGGPVSRAAAAAELVRAEARFAAAAAAAGRAE